MRKIALKKVDHLRPSTRCRPKFLCKVGPCSGIWFTNSQNLKTLVCAQLGLSHQRFICTYSWMFQVLQYSPCLRGTSKMIFSSLEVTLCDCWRLLRCQAPSALNQYCVFANTAILLKVHVIYDALVKNFLCLNLVII